MLFIYRCSILLKSYGYVVRLGRIKIDLLLFGATYRANCIYTHSLCHRLLNRRHRTTVEVYYTNKLCFEIYYVAYIVLYISMYLNRLSNRVNLSMQSHDMYIMCVRVCMCVSVYPMKSHGNLHIYNETVQKRKLSCSASLSHAVI